MNHTARHICILLFVLIITAIVVSAPPARGEGDSVHDAALSTLKKHLTKKGYDVDILFGHDDFEIYAGIDALFKNSAENKGIRPVNKAKKEQGKKAAEKVFADELAKYKRHLGFSKKARELSRFIEEHAEALEAGERKYGVPKELVAAVVGIESRFGRSLGRHRAVNVYISMYVKNYRRKWALAQLEELLRFAKKRNEDVYTYKSSYAGAIGAMQFLPWSLNRWFIGDDVGDMDDCLMSAANYLGHFKKKRGTLYRAVYAYNPSRLYTRTVLDLADSVKISEQ